MGAEGHVPGAVLSARDARRHGAEAEHGDLRQERQQSRQPGKSGGRDSPYTEGMRAAGGGRDRLPIRRTIGRRSDAASESDERDGPTALAGDVLLWTRAAT